MCNLYLGSEFVELLVTSSTSLMQWVTFVFIASECSKFSYMCHHHDLNSIHEPIWEDGKTRSWQKVAGAGMGKQSGLSCMYCTVYGIRPNCSNNMMSEWEKRKLLDNMHNGMLKPRNANVLCQEKSPSHTRRREIQEWVDRAKIVRPSEKQVWTACHWAWCKLSPPSEWSGSWRVHNSFQTEVYATQTSSLWSWHMRKSLGWPAIDHTFGNLDSQLIENGNL